MVPVTNSMSGVQFSAMSAVHCSAMLFSKVQCQEIQFCSLQYSEVQSSAIQCRLVQGMECSSVLKSWLGVTLGQGSHSDWNL